MADWVLSASGPKRSDSAWCCFPFASFSTCIPTAVGVSGRTPSRAMLTCMAKVCGRPEFAILPQVMPGYEINKGKKRTSWKKASGGNGARKRVGKKRAGDVGADAPGTAEAGLWVRELGRGRGDRSDDGTGKWHLLSEADKTKYIDMWSGACQRSGTCHGCLLGLGLRLLGCLQARLFPLAPPYPPPRSGHGSLLA
jgi:hypothetical protein